MTTESKPPLMLEAGIIYYQLLRLLKFSSLKLQIIKLNNEIHVNVTKFSLLITS